jgi:hypothetical protein
LAPIFESTGSMASTWNRESGLPTRLLGGVAPRAPCAPDSGDSARSSTGSGVCAPSTEITSGAAPIRRPRTLPPIVSDLSPVKLSSSGLMPLIVDSSVFARSACSGSCSYTSLASATRRPWRSSVS